jgi:hypothetical protein
MDVVSLSFIQFPYLHRGKKNRNKKDKTYHNYSTTMPSGEPWATERGTYNTNEYEARRAWVQRVST